MIISGMQKKKIIFLSPTIFTVSYQNGIKDIAITTYSKAMRDTPLLRKTFRFDFDSYKFENDITISHISIDNAYIVFVGILRIQGEKEVTRIIKFSDFLIQKVLAVLKES